MLAISRTRTPEDCLIHLNTDQARARPRPRIQTEIAASKTEQLEDFPPLSFGSAWSTDSDPFPELLPWDTLFQSHICEPSPVAMQSIPSDISKADSFLEDSLSVDMAQILDPTSLAFGFQQSCLHDLDDGLLYNPLQALVSACWEGVDFATESQEPDIAREKAGSQWCPLEDEDSTLDMEDALCTTYRPSRQIPIHVPMSASLLWSDDSDSDSDECSTIQDGYPSRSPYRNIGLLASVHPVGPFAAIAKEKSISYKDLTASVGTFEPIFLLDNGDHIGQSPTPRIIPAKDTKGSVPKRFAAFCARFPSRVVTSAAIAG